MIKYLIHFVSFQLILPVLGGFLYPELGTDPNIIFPTIEVYVCARFADEQPAKKGNIFM